MQRFSLFHILFAVLIVGAACTGIVYAAGSLGVKETRRIASVNPKAAPQNASVEWTPGRKQLDYYSGGIASQLFGVPSEPKPPPAKPLPLPPPPMPEAPDPFSDFVYSGTVSLNGQTLALLENRKTKAGHFLGVGQPFLGGKVASLNDRQVVIDLGTTTRALAKTDDFKMVSLDRNAPFMGSGGQPGGPGGAPGPPSGGSGGMPGGINMGMSQSIPWQSPTSFVSGDNAIFSFSGGAASYSIKAPAMDAPAQVMIEKLGR